MTTPCRKKIDGLYCSMMNKKYKTIQEVKEKFQALS